MSNVLCFDLYRYQIIPIAREFQLHLDREVDYEKVIRQKNSHFAEALIAATFRYKRQLLVHSLDVITPSENFLLTIAREKQVSRYTEDFKKEQIESFPPTRIFIINRSDVQICAVERNMYFSHTDVIVNKIIAPEINRYLKKNYLTAKFSAITDKNSFWDFAKKNEGKVTSIEFHLVTPNMSNMSAMLSEELKSVAKGTRAATTNVKLKSEHKNYLEVSRENKQLADIVNYAAQGGGDVFVKITGKKARFVLGENQVTIDIPSSSIDSESREQLPKQISEYVNGYFR
ncbi:hypothetical protein [Oleidesulfovibrio alaskensis]|uniref:hypothetical protein n=1 Tax=Oleidesulfovibrio alaskensis TaxID=58180 RepID=UPI000482BB7C|nr:hypothetical protein [Oleidesulfovibrio alaskensis]